MKPAYNVFDIDPAEYKKQYQFDNGHRKPMKEVGLLAKAGTEQQRLEKANLKTPQIFMQKLDRDVRELGNSVVFSGLEEQYHIQAKTSYNNALRIVQLMYSIKLCLPLSFLVHAQG